MKPETIKIDDVEYVRSDSLSAKAPSVDGMDFVMIRSRDSGVHFGYLKSKDGDEVVLLNSRRVYYWEGAATLSQLANSGTTKPGSCKFPEVLPKITILGVVEIIPISAQAKSSLEAVKTWKV